MAKYTQIAKKWISARFDGKVVVTVSQNDKGFVNLQIATISKRAFKTKLGQCTSVAVTPAILGELQEVIAEVLKIYKEHRVALHA